MWNVHRVIQSICSGAPSTFLFVPVQTKSQIFEQNSAHSVPRTQTTVWLYVLKHDAEAETVHKQITKLSKYAKFLPFYFRDGINSWS